MGTHEPRCSGILRRLPYRLRTGARSTLSLPGYTSTKIDPAPIPSRPRRAAAPSAIKPPSVSEVRKIEGRACGLTHKLHKPPPAMLESQQADAVQAICSERAFARTIASLFVFENAQATTDPHIEDIIRTLAALAHAQSAEDSPVRYAGALQCARALAAATGGDAARAAEALAHLQGNFSIDVRNANYEMTLPPTAAQRHAWHVARMLAHTANGFDALVTLQCDPTFDEATADGAMKRESFRTFLQAADYLANHVAVNDTIADTPSQQFHQAIQQMAAMGNRDEPCGLALNALLCAAKLYATPHASAQMIGDSTQVAAYVAWRSGYRESGKHSFLARSKGRLAKFLTWIGRSQRRARHRWMAFDPRRTVGMRKSPLTATTFDAGGVDLRLQSEETRALRDAVHAAIDASLACHRMVTQHTSENALSPPISPEVRGVLLLRELYLDYWKRSASPDQRASELTLTSDDRRAIASALIESAPRVHVNAHVILANAEFQRVKTLNLSTLERWSDEVAQHLRHLHHTQGNTSEVKERVATARYIEQGKPIRPTSTTTAALREALSQVISAAPLGNNVRYFDGGMYGINVNSSLNLHEFHPHSLAPWLSPTPGVKALHGRHAFVEIGSSSYGGEVFMGTDTRYSSGVGLSVFAGVTLGTKSVHAVIGGGAGVSYSNDRSAPTGVIIRTRLRRDANGRPTNSWRELANNVVDFLFEQQALSEATQSMSAERLWQNFSTRFFRTPDISVNWRDQRRSSHTVSGNATLMARAAAFGVHVGPVASISYDQLLAGKNERVDANGWLRGTERSRGRSSVLTASVSILGSVSSAGHFSTHAAHPESISVPSMPIVGLTVPIAPRGASVTLRMVEEHGRFNQKYVRRLVEFVDPTSFLSYIEMRRPEIARTSRSAARLDAFISEVRSNATRGNQAFGESNKITVAVAEMLSAYQDEITIIRMCSRGSLSARDTAQMALLEGEMARLLNEPSSWTVSGYYSYEINSRGYAAGPAFGLQASAMTSTAGERVLAELAISELIDLDSAG